MRVTPAFTPSFMQRFPFGRPLTIGMVCMALSLSGCASRSILGEKPVAAKQGGAPVVPGSGAQTTTVTPLQKFLWVFSPYRPVIQQGNFISEEMISQLKVGMTRDQVRFLLGTPLLTDLFHADRWDYPFRLAKGNGEVTSSRVVVFFKDNKVERFEGGNLPTEKEYIARIAGPAPAIKGAKKEEAAATQAPVNAAPLPSGPTSGNDNPAPVGVGSAPVSAPAPAPASSPAPAPAPSPEPAK